MLWVGRLTRMVSFRRNLDACIFVCPPWLMFAPCCFPLGVIRWLHVSYIVCISLILRTLTCSCLTRWSSLYREKEPCFGVSNQELSFHESIWDMLSGRITSHVVFVAILTVGYTQVAWLPKSRYMAGDVSPIKEPVRIFAEFTTVFGLKIYKKTSTNIFWKIHSMRYKIQFPSVDIIIFTNFSYL